MASLWQTYYITRLLRPKYQGEGEGGYQNVVPRVNVFAF
jgi:hypothetical protein